MKRKYTGNATIFALLFLLTLQTALAHPLRLSLSEIEKATDQEKLSVSLRLFLMDIREALLFDPENDELAFCQPNEAENAESLLLSYLDQFFYIKVNDEKLDLNIASKRLHGEGINLALAVEFEFPLTEQMSSLEIKNAVFTDLFFDQSNIVYVYLGEETESLMLNKDTPIHRLDF